MGCDIHIITEIRKNNKWEYIPEVPKSLDARNYSTFAYLAKVRDNFSAGGFEPKGLPDDISGKLFNFVSETPWHHECYETKTATCLVDKDGKIHVKKYPYDNAIEKCKLQITDSAYYWICNTMKIDESLKERYDTPGYSQTGNETKYYVSDAAVIGGKWKEIPFKEIYKTFEEFEKAEYGESEKDEIANDYGYWKVDFDSEDYHTPSYISLKELLNRDYSDYTVHKCKMSKVLYNKFIEVGGVMPDVFTIKETSCGDFADSIRESFDPTVVVQWQMTEKEKEENNLPILNGINELKEIAEKYEITNPEDIRIVFAFDN